MFLFFLFQNGHRSYKVGQKLIKLKKKSVEKLREWNLFPSSELILLDKRIIRALVYSCVKNDGFENAEEKQSVLDFIHGK